MSLYDWELIWVMIVSSWIHCQLSDSILCFKCSSTMCFKCSSFSCSGLLSWTTWCQFFSFYVSKLVFSLLRMVTAWELDHKEGWASKNWCFPTVVLEKTLESPLVCKEIKLVNPTGVEPWVFIRRTDAEAEAPICRPPDMKNWLTGKDPEAGKVWR